MCLYPKLIKNPKYKETAKNGGVIPAVSDPRVLYVPIGCQNCIECRKQKAREWQVRLLEDIKQNTNGKFITLTFSNEWIYNIINGYETENGYHVKGIWEENPEMQGYELDNQIATRATRLFLERWRKEHKKSLRHWLITELGHEGTQNIHIHGIVWTDKEMNEIRSKWQYGYMWPRPETTTENYVSERTVNYIIKYVTKQDEDHRGYKPIILTSAGIGRNYTDGYNSKNNKYKPAGTNELYRTSTGHKIAMPVYWRNKIYTEEEREKLWLQKLDKEERYVCGEKVSIKTNNAEYWKLLKWHRQRAQELGYITTEEIRQRKQYEEMLRQMMTAKRLAGGQLNMNTD